MFKIYDGREHFYQWDLDRKLIVGDRTIQAVHFCNRTGACAITRDCYDVNGMWLVDVPNLCLQESYRLKVYGFSAAKYTTVSSQFDVKSRTKPDGYVYTDDEVNCWQDLDQRVAALEENPVSDEALDRAIEGYFAENPVDLTGYATEEYVNTAISNIEVGGGGECAVEIVNATGDEVIELDKTYQEIMAMIEAGKNVVINYDGNLYHQFSDSPVFRFVGAMETRQISFNKRDYSVRYNECVYPAFEDIGTIVEDTISAAMPDFLTGYATEEYVDNAVANAGGSADCSVMIIKSNNSTDSIQLEKTFDEIKTATDKGKMVVILHNNKYYPLTKKSLSLFTFSLTEKTMINKILVYQSMVKTSEDNFITTNDIANFQTAEQVEEAINAAIPDVSAYQTAEQVNAAIVAYVGVIENGTY